MKRVLKLSVVIIAILSGILMVWAKTATVESNLIETAAESNSKLFNSNCARCHGADGKGNTKLGMDLATPDLTTSRISSAKIRQVIVNGDGDMPAFKKKFKAAQVTSLVNYVRALRR
jgi:mono/diheme cytochrome c family protein